MQLGHLSPPVGERNSRWLEFVRGHDRQGARPEPLLLYHLDVR